jgi:uncharacterized membrane protein YqhA
MQKVIRSAIFVIVSLVLLDSLFFIVLGVYKSVHAYILFAQGRMEEKPGIMIAESLDSFMIALFFLIFTIGISRLFLPKLNFLNGYDLPWLKIDNFSQLKYIMWEVLLTTILVYFTTKIIIAGGDLEWTMLIIPASILMLALAYKLLKQGH